MVVRKNQLSEHSRWSLESSLHDENYLESKGLDSSAGGKPSPILRNGQIFSIPIPTTDKNSPHRYRDVFINNINASDMLSIVGEKIGREHRLSF